MIKVIIRDPDITNEENAAAIQNSLNVLSGILREENLIAEDEYIDNPWKDKIIIDENYVPRTHTYYY